jgi:ribosome maturation factor RimP
LADLNRIKQAAEQEASKIGLKVYSVGFEEAEGAKVLHIELDKKGGVTLKEVSDFTDLINPILDQMADLDFPYSLDCSSPGAERFIPLEELSEHLGEYMEISLNDRKALGTLEEIEDDRITLKGFIKGRPKKDVIRKADIRKIQLRIKL